MSTLVGAARLDLTVTTQAAKAAVTAAAAAMRTQLQTLARPVKTSVKVDQAGVKAEVNKAKAQFSRLGTEVKDLVKVDLSALNAVLSQIGKQVTDLRAVEQALKGQRGGPGGNGGGQGGGGPPAPNSSAADRQAAANYRATLALNLRLAREAAQQQAAAARQARQQEDAANRQSAANYRQTLALNTRLAREAAQQQAAAARQASQAQATADRQAAANYRATQALNTRLAREAAQQQAAAARQAAQAQSDGVTRLARDLQTAQSRYERGATGLKAYLREMERIRTAGQGMAGGLAAGSREAQALERVMGGLSRGTAKINDQSIVKLRGDLAGARAEFERATAAAGRFNFSAQRQATQAYEAALRGLETRLRSVGERGTVTASQLRSVNQLSAQLGSQRNALQGSFTPLGLSGGVVNALRSLPQFAAQAGGSLGAAAAQASSLGGSFSALAVAAGPVGLAIGAVTLVLAGLTAGLKASVDTAAQFEQTLADIKALTQPTTAELTALTRATFDIGKPLGVGAREAAGAVLELNKAGLSAKDVIGGGLKGALDLAGAAGISAAEGGKLAVSAMTAFGLSAKDLPRVADVFANFANKTFLGAEDLSQAIAAVGPVARDAGIDLQQFSGLMATLAQGGFKNMSDAGTSLKTMLLSLTAPVDTGAKALAALKLSAFDGAGKMRPLNDVLGELRSKLVQLTPEAQKQLLRQIFGQDALRAAQILLREGPRAIDANTAAMRKQGEAARVARERLQSLQGAGKQFGAAFEQIKIQIGTPFLGALAAIVRGATSVVTALSGMIDLAGKGQGPLATFAAAGQQAMNGLSSVVQSAFGGIKAAWERVLLPVLQVLGQIWSTVQTAVVTALGIVLQVVSGVFQAARGVVEGFVTAFFGQGKNINLTLAGISAKFAEWAGIARVYIVAVGKIAATLPPVFRGVGLGIGQIIAGVVRVLGGLATGARAVFQAAGGYALAFLRTLGTLGTSTGKIIAGVGQILLAFALAAKNAFVDRVRDVFSAAGRLFTTFGTGIGRLLQPAAQGFFRFVVQPAQAMGNFLRAAFDRVVSILGGAVQAAGRILAPLGNVLSALGISIGATLQNAASAASSALASFVDRGAAQSQAAYDAAQRAAEAQAQATSTGVGDILDQGLKAATTGLQDFAKDNGTGAQLNAGVKTLQSGVAGLAGAGNDLSKSLGATTSALKNNLDTSSQQIRGASTDFAAGVKTVQGAVGDLGATTGKVMAGVSKDLKAAQGAAQQTAKAVQQASTGPAVLPSGTKTLADLGLGPKPTAGKVTAADLVRQAAYKKGLKDLTDQELKTAKAEAIRTNNKKAITAILAEETRREREHGRALTTTGIALTKYKQALRGKSEQQLKDLALAAQARKDTAAYNAVLAEQARRTREGAAASRQSSAELARDTAARANLVREIRQSIAAFGLQASQGKVTAASQLAFNQRMEDFQAKVNKLPAALRAGTQALFDQAKALSTSVNGQVAAAKATTLSGAALIKYKEALRGKSAEQLKTLEADARQRNLGPQLSAVLAEQKRRLDLKAAADKNAAREAVKHQEAAGNLERETRQLNERFQTQISQGKVTAESLQGYGQALEDARAKLEKLPPAYRAGTQALLTQGTALAQQGQTVVEHRQEVDKLREAVDAWTYAELENARARVLANGGDAEKLKVLDAEIAKRKTLSDATAAQAHAESELAAADAGQEQVEGEYNARKEAARGNLAELYQIELQFGQRLQAARDAAAQAQATRDREATNKKYADLLALEGLSAEKRTQLEQDRDRDLAAIETRRTSAVAANLAARNTAELDAKESLDEALIGLDRRTRDTIRKNNLEELERQTADVEARQAADLEAEDLTEQQKLAIRERYRPELLAAKTKEVEASRVIEVQAEQDRFDDAVEEARKQLGTTQAFLDAKAKLEAEHTSNVGAINRRLNDGLRDYTTQVTREVNQQRVASERATSQDLLDEAKNVTDVQLENLDEQTTAQRNAARAVLLGWKTTYEGMGEAGAKAVAEIEKALGKLDAQDKRVQAAAEKLVADPADVSRTIGGKLARIEKPEDAEGAREAAVARFDELLTTYKGRLTEVQDALEAFGKIAEDALTPKQRSVRDGLRATAEAYRTGIATITTAATTAGNAAATAFTQAQQDQAAESALALAEINYELAQQEGRDGGPAYRAGLQAALTYWRGRLAGLTAGTPEYLEALRKIADLEGKVTAAKSNPLTESLKQASSIIGKGGPLQSALSAGLDGLAAFFTAGGKGGGRGAILQGAAAFVGGLVDVFKTGDEDVDSVVSTFVSGIQGVLSQLATGNWQGAIIAGAATLISTVIDIFRGGANSAKKAAQQVADATKGVKFFDTSKYAKVVSQGGFWGFLGFKKTEIDQEAVDIAQTLGDALYSSISQGMLDGIKAGKTSFADLGLDLRAGLSQQILQGLIDGFLKGAVMQGILQPFLDKYVEAMKSGNAQALAEAANGIQQAAVGANGALQDFYQNVLVPTAQSLGQFGTDTQSSAVGGSAAADLGLAQAPTAVAAAPTWALDFTGQLGELTPVLRELTPTLKALSREGLAVRAQTELTVHSPQNDLSYALNP